MKIYISPKEFTNIYLPIFRQNKEFTRLFDKEFSNKAFYIFGIRYECQNLNNQFVFETIDDRIWFLSKIKYGL